MSWMDRMFERSQQYPSSISGFSKRLDLAHHRLGPIRHILRTWFPIERLPGSSGLANDGKLPFIIQQTTGDRL